MRPDPRAARRRSMPASHAVLITLAVLSLAAIARAGEPTVDQMLALRRASSPAVSPDGRFVAYTVRDTDLVGNAYVTQLWLADVTKHEVRPLTFGTKSNTAPVTHSLWSLAK